MFYLTTRPGGATHFNTVPSFTIGKKRPERATHFNPVATPRVNNETRLAQRPEKLVPKSGGRLILIHSPKIFMLKA